MTISNRKIFILVLLVGALSAFVPLGHAHEAHNKNTANSNTSTDRTQPVNGPGQPVPAPSSDVSVASATHIEEFPTIHPLIVHFPIMLIILAAAFQVASMFVFRREMSWVVAVMALFGSIGAYLASNVFHPHTTGLTESAQRLLVEHELYASYSLWLAAAGFVVKVISQFVLDRRWWSETIVTVVLLAAAIAVAWAGHHGAELVHKEGVGPRGNFLEMHDP